MNGQNVFVFGDGKLGVGCIRNKGVPCFIVKSFTEPKVISSRLPKIPIEDADVVFEFHNKESLEVVITALNQVRDAFPGDLERDA